MIKVIFKGRVLLMVNIFVYPNVGTAFQASGNYFNNVKFLWLSYVIHVCILATTCHRNHTQHLFTVKKKIPQLSQIPIAQGDWWQFIQRKPLIFYKSSEKKILKIIFSNQHVLPMYVNNMIYTTLTFKFKISGQFLKKVTLC
jgi:hypothetical protein